MSAHVFMVSWSCRATANHGRAPSTTGENGSADVVKLSNSSRYFIKQNCIRPKGKLPGVSCVKKWQLTKSIRLMPLNGARLLDTRVPHGSQFFPGLVITERTKCFDEGFSWPPPETAPVTLMPSLDAFTDLCLEFSPPYCLQRKMILGFLASQIVKITTNSAAQKLHVLFQMFPVLLQRWGESANMHLSPQFGLQASCCWR